LTLLISELILCKFYVNCIFNIAFLYLPILSVLVKPFFSVSSFDIGFPFFPVFLPLSLPLKSVLVFSFAALTLLSIFFNSFLFSFAKFKFLSRFLLVNGFSFSKSSPGFSAIAHSDLSCIFFSL